MFHLVMAQEKDRVLYHINTINTKKSTREKARLIQRRKALCHRRFGKTKKHDSFRYLRIKTIVLIWRRRRDLNPRAGTPSLLP